LRFAQLWRNQAFLYGVRVDAVVNLGQRALEVPFQRCRPRFIVLETLEFLDEV